MYNRTMSVTYTKTKTRRTATLAIFAVVTAIALVTGASLNSSVLAVKSSTSVSGLKKFFDCVTKSAKNGKPNRQDVDNCYDKTYSSSAVSSSASAGSGGGGGNGNSRRLESNSQTIAIE